MSKQIGNPLEQAIISGTIGKRSEQPEKPSDATSIPIRKVGRKATKKERVQHTIYLPPALSKWVKVEAYEQGREISDVTADALLMYKEKRDRTNNL